MSAIGVLVSYLLEAGHPIWKILIAAVLIYFAFSAISIQLLDYNKIETWSDIGSCFVWSATSIVDVLIMWGLYCLIGVYGPIVYSIPLGCIKLALLRVEIKSLYEEIHKEEDHEPDSMDDQAQNISVETDRPDYDGDESEQTE